MRQISADTRLHALAAALVLTTVSVLTWAQCHVYRNVETLWVDTIEKNPSCWMAYNNLGNLLLDRRRIPEAHACFARAIEINPRGVEARASLGKSLCQMGNVEQASGIVIEGLDLDPNEPTLRAVWGLILLEKGQFAEAEDVLRALLRDRPDGDTHHNLGVCLARQDRSGEAVEQFQFAVVETPNNPVAHFNLANALASVGAHARATAATRMAIRVADAQGCPDLADMLRRRQIPTTAHDRAIGPTKSRDVGVSRRNGAD